RLKIPEAEQGAHTGRIGGGISGHYAIPVEIVVDVFDAEDHIPRDRILSASTDEQTVVLRVRDFDTRSRAGNEASPRPTSGAIDHPVVSRIAETSTELPHAVEARLARENVSAAGAGGIAAKLTVQLVGGVATLDTDYEAPELVL